MNKLLQMVFVFVLMLLAGCGQSNQEKSVADLVSKVEATEDFVSHGEMSAESAEKALARLIERARETTGDSTLDREGLSKWQGLQNHGEAVNWMLILAGIVCGAGLILMLTLMFQEAAASVLSLLGFLGGLWLLFGCAGTYWYTVPGCVLMAASTAYFAGRTRSKSVFTSAAFALALLWGIAALTTQSMVIAVLSVLALEASLGFISGVGIGYAFIGFDEEDAISRCTGASLILLILGFFLHIGVGPADFVQYAAVYKTALLSVGTFVFMTGMLIMSCKYYKANYRYSGRYVLMQVLMIAAGVGISSLGFVYNVGFFKGVAGVFLLLYLAEKYVEIPWRGSWPLAVLGFGGVLWGFARFMDAFPQLFPFVG